MGEYAEMMLDGTCCAGCGVYLDGGGNDGFVSYCSDECAIDQGANWFAADQGMTAKKPKPFACDTCGKSFDTPGKLAQHKTDKTHKADPSQAVKCVREKIKGGAYGLQMHMNAKGCGPHSKTLERTEI